MLSSIEKHGDCISGSHDNLICEESHMVLGSPDYAPLFQDKQPKNKAEQFTNL